MKGGQAPNRNYEKRIPKDKAIARGDMLQGIIFLNPLNSYMSYMASLGRLELPTYGLGGRRSIH